MTNATKEPFAALVTQAAVEPAVGICTIHGRLNKPYCDECDKAAGEEVVKARQSTTPQATVPPDIQGMVDAAVQKALDEERSFQAWKAQQATPSEAPQQPQNPEQPQNP